MVRESEYNTLRNSYDNIRTAYIKTIRHLREIWLYKRMTESSESWGDDREIHEWLSNDSKKAFREVVARLKVLRSRLDKTSERLMDIKSKKGDDNAKR